MAANGYGFCVDSVLINGHAYTDKIKSSAFEVDFQSIGLAYGDSVTLVIYHQLDCLPKVLNPAPVTPRSSFETEYIKVENDSLKWSTTTEHFKLTYIIEQYRWNKWIKIGEEDGMGLPKGNKYSFNVKPYLHFGLNEFRVKQIDYVQKPNISQAATYDGPSTECTISAQTTHRKDSLQFSKITLYEIFDVDGNLVKKGTSNFISFPHLKKGQYFLNYGNQTGVEILLK